MGVPKFYKWISERYPCLSEIVKDHQIPEFDNLYLDMNGIIHACSHPEDKNPHFRITEEKIFADIFHYLEVLFRMIKPRKVFFMAVDGVAPRAKMNQQRSRRFRSPKEFKSLEEAARKRGEKLPAEARFDSNCITPGTPFMVRLHDNLKYFVTNKMSTDSLWHGVTVYLSGHETPGEGEHKIMDFIRCLKASSTYDPNTRHCLYGLDADLIMLGLTSHEPRFAILREEGFLLKVTQKRSVIVEDGVFRIFHISLLREYLDLEFQSVKESLMAFEYNLERIIDDWVLMGFLVGNDFIPHLPHLHIAHDALPTIWTAYKQVLPELDGYLNEGGVINLRRLEIFLRSLSDFDMKKFEEDTANTKSKKDGSRQQARARKQVTKVAAMNQKPDELDSFEPSSTEPVEGLEVEGTPFVPQREAGETDKSFLFRKQKSHYYYSKMNLQATPEVLAQQACDYITGLQWILLYYYRGVPSWGWFFPHHYAPYMSDLKCFSGLSMEFTPGSPFLPFQQLMAVLPPASKQLLPEPYQGLMTESTSPILEFYPVDFGTDMNEKQQDWEAIVLIPIIQQDRLLAAMSEREPQLTQEERERNKHGPCLIYSYSKESQGMYPACAMSAFPDIVNNHTIVETRNWWEFVVPPEQLNTGLCAGVQLTFYYPGFPTLSHIPHHLEKQSSRGENFIIQIRNELDKDNLKLDELRSELVGKSIWVNWPHLIEAKVTAIEKVNRDEDKKSSPSNKITSVYKKKNVDIGPTFIIVYALPIAGRKYVYLKNARVTVEKQWQKVLVAFALQACVRHEVMMLKGGVDDFGSLQTFSLSDVFPVDSTGLLLSPSRYGCQALVLGVDDGRVRIYVDIPEEPDFAPLMQPTKTQKVLPTYKCPTAPSGGDFLEEEIVRSIKQIVDDRIKRCQGDILQEHMTVEPHLLYRPFSISALTLPDPDTQFRLFDRVVNVRQGFTVPFGLRGTVIGIIAGAQQQDMYDVVFDVAFPCITRCSPDRRYRVPPRSLLNLSRGLRSEAVE